MTRPFTGQRNLGIAGGDVGLGRSAARARCAAGVDHRGAGRRLRGAAGTAGDLRLRRGAASAAAAQPVAGRLAAAACGARTPGMTMRSPTFTMRDAARCCWPWRSRQRLADTCATAPSASRRARRHGRAGCCWSRARRSPAPAVRRVGRRRAAPSMPVASYFGITSRWPGCSAVPFGMLLACDRGGRHAVARHQAVDGLALLHRDGGAALPVPARAAAARGWRGCDGSCAEPV